MSSVRASSGHGPAQEPQSGSNLAGDQPAAESCRVLTGPIVLVMSVGLALLAACVVRGHAADSASETNSLYWIALGVTFVPAAWRILAPQVRTRERVVLSLALALMLQLGRTVLFPVRFMLHDELIHQNGARLIDQTHHLFAANPLLPVASYYPTLEITTVGIHQATGLSVHTCAILVLLLARVILTLSIIGLFKAMTGSLWAGCVANLVYVCNSQYVAFNSQFSYQTLALPIAVFTVYVFVTRRHTPGWRRLVLPLLALIFVVFSHHLTSMLLAAGLTMWLLVEVVLHRRNAERATAVGLLVMVVIAAATIVGWAYVPGNPVISYLREIAQSSGSALSQLLAGKQTHTLFRDSAGVATPAWERVVSFAGVIAVAVVLAVSLIGTRAWRRRDGLIVTLLLMSLIYPLIPAGHLTTTTSEVTDRASGFVFVGVAMAITGWLLVVRDRDRARLWTVGSLLVATVIFVGNSIVGAGPPTLRVPGPYLVAADERTLDSFNLAAANWLSHHVPPDTRIYADRDSSLIDAATGNAFTVTHLGTNIDASPILLAPKFTSVDINLIREANIHYVVVDERDSTALPSLDVYIESGEYGGPIHRHPVTSRALHKLDHVDGVQRVYDNGAIAIYNVSVFDAS